MGTITLPAASESLQQAMRDFLLAHDEAMSADEIASGLALSSALGAIKYTLTFGSTPEARKKLEGARKQINAALGIE